MNSFAPSAIRRGALVAALVLPLLAVACGEKAPPPPPPAQPPAPPALPAPPVGPDSFRLSFSTSKGTFVVAVNRAWSPFGADRLHELAKADYFKDVRFFRVVPGFIAQFGMHGDPAVNAQWTNKAFADDPVTQSNKRGTIVFATAGPNTRSNQFFINLVDNAGLDSRGFSPVGTVVEGMKVVDALYNGYGESVDAGGTGPSQGQIGAQGNTYLKKDFPKLDYIKSVTIK